VDRSTPPILFHHGEGFRLERLPAGSRVVYPAEPVAPLADPDGAIRHALLNPVGDSQPLPSLLYAGMKLTIAMDNQAVPLPPMQRPDNRQRVIEIVLDMAAAAGVDDVELIIAHGLHRRQTEAELRHMVGDRIYDAFAVGYGEFMGEDPAAQAIAELRLVAATLMRVRAARHNRPWPSRASTSSSTSGP